MMLRMMMMMMIEVDKAIDANDDGAALIPVPSISTLCVVFHVLFASTVNHLMCSCSSVGVPDGGSTIEVSTIEGSLTLGAIIG